MAVYNYKSQNKSMVEGATDGKYRKVRPNTDVAPGLGEEIVEANRRGLHPFFNYGFIDTETEDKVVPGAIKVPKAQAPSFHSAPVFDMDAYMNQQDY
jgi:hypothetical protein